MTSEPQEFIRPQRKGRMTGVDIQIDGETWTDTLRKAEIPLDTPLDELRIKRYPCKGGRIILKVKRIQA